MCVAVLVSGGLAMQWILLTVVAVAAFTCPITMGGNTHQSKSMISIFHVLL